MSLKIEDWGKILIKHYQNNPDSFYISLIDLVAGARRHDPEFVTKIEAGRKEKESSFTLEELVTRCFASSLCKERNLMSASKLAKILKKTWKFGPPGSDLCVLALLICACESHTDGIRLNNYYDRLYSFLCSKDIGYHLEENTSFSIFLRGRDNLDLMGLTKSVNKTCAAYSIPLSLEVKQGDGGYYRYADTIMSLCLINGTVSERFKRIYGISGFTPLEFPSDEELISAFATHYNEIKISDDDARMMISERDMLIRSLRKAFERWDGTTTYTSHSNLSGESFTETDTTIESIILAIVPDISSDMCAIQAYLHSEANLESNTRHYVSEDGNHFMIRLYNGKSRDVIKNNTVSVGDLVKNALECGKSFYFVDKDNDCKAVFRPRNFYLFSNFYGVLEESTKPIPGNSYLLMVRKNKLEETLQLLGSSEAAPYLRTRCPIEGFELYSINELKELPNGNRRKCGRAIEVSIDNFIYGETIKTVVLYPTCRLLVSINSFSDQPLSVKITSTDQKKSFPLAIESDIWVLDFSQIRFDSFDRSRTWHLYVDNQRELNYEFRFGTLQLPEKFKGMSLNIDGEIEDFGEVFGLDLTPYQLQFGHIVDATRMSVASNKTPLPKKPSFFNEKSPDILLYALTSLSYDFFTLKDIERTADIVAPHLLDSLGSLLNEWFIMGYINTGHQNGKRKYVVNTPSLVLLTPDYTPANVKGVKASSVPYFTCLFTGGRSREFIEKLMSFQSKRPRLFSIEFANISPHLPHSVLIHSKELNAFSEIASHLVLQFNPRVYAPAMFAGLPTISEYQKEAQKHPAAYSGEALTYNINAVAADLQSGKMRRASDYKMKRRGISGLNIYSVYGRKVGVMVDAGGRSYHVGRNWGFWIQAAQQKQSLAIGKGNKLAVPGVAPLPRIYQRALCLITGRLPHYDEKSKINYYHLASNPTATGQYVTAQGIINKLISE